MDDTTIRAVIPRATRFIYRGACAAAYGDALSACDLTTLQGQSAAARMRSSACRAASAWIDTVPTCRELRLSNSAFVLAMRHRAGISALPANAPAVLCFCGKTILRDDLDHAMVCNRLSHAMNIRHNILNRAWPFVARRAGIATSVEPEISATASGCAGRTSYGGARRSSAVGAGRHLDGAAGGRHRH